MIEISVVVPIFNVENYLERSINSLINQTFKNLEIILVNDGSTDNSKLICEQFKKLDDRIILINKKNEGVSIARNTGIENARGKYIVFMDPDDSIDLEMYDSLYNAIEKANCDICMCNYNRVENNHIKKIKLPFESGLHEKETIDNLILELVCNKNFGEESVMGSPWRAIYRSDIIRENNIIFPKNIRPMQDLIFNLQYLKCCESLYIIQDFHYSYYVNEGSGVTSYNPKGFENSVKVYEFVKNCVTQEIDSDELGNRLKNRWIDLVLRAIWMVAHKDNPDKLVHKYKEISKILNHDNTVLASRTINTKNLKIKNRLLIYAIKTKKVVFLYFYYKLTNKLRALKKKPC